MHHGAQDTGALIAGGDHLKFALRVARNNAALVLSSARFFTQHFLGSGPEHRQGRGSTAHHFQQGGFDKSQKGALKKISKALENKKIVIVLLDQRDILNGEKIRVCGQEAILPTALIKYAMKSKCFIFSGVSYHKQNKTHIEGQAFLSEKDFQNKSAKDIVQQMFDSFSIAIKKHPTQWYCLMHDLWRK